MKFLITKKFIEGSLKGLEYSTQTYAERREDEIGKVFGGGWLGPKYILVSCELIEESSEK